MARTDKVQSMLAFFARKILAKHQPFIIGVTGSVGKTSTRHAIAAALGAKYKLREPIKNYNNEIGIPLTIIGTKSWDDDAGSFAKQKALMRIILKGLLAWLGSDYPKVLVLEYGVDHPGDMDIYLEIAKPNLTVFTAVDFSHKEFFESQEQIAQEKGKLAAALPADGTFVYNADDPLVASQVARTTARTVSFGTAQAGHSADVILEKVDISLGGQTFSNLQIKTPSRTLHVTLPAIGAAHEKAALVAVAVAEAMEVESDLIINGLANYRPMPGRLNVISGIKKSIILDDSYNAAPISTIAGLNLLAKFPNKIKMAALGDMLELGDSTDKAHKEVGELAAAMDLQKLITVGELGKKIAVSAIAAGMPAEKVISFPDSDTAKSEVLKMLEPESVIFVKGSQGVRMEKISKELMAQPLSAAQFLPRQYGKWLES